MIRCLKAAAIVVAAGFMFVPQGHAQQTSDARHSGLQDMRPATQAMQRDDAQNPGMLWVQGGEALWSRPAGRSERSCASCHGDAATRMKGVSARYPAFSTAHNRPINLQQRINECRQEQQQAEPWRAESEELLSMEAYVAYQSRGQPLAPADDARLAPFRARGQQLFMQRIGQLNLACAQCHDALAGKRLAGNVIPQAHPTGYPIYRLEWQGLGSLQRRLRNCMVGVRAEPYAFGAQELVELELYLADRAKGMPVETPAVRP